MPVDTTKVEGRRKLDYTSFDDLLADADRLSSGPVKVLGNWSAGQVFQHLAIAYNGSIDGLTITVPWFVRVLATILKSRFLDGPMPAGYKLPADGAKALMPAPTSPEEGLAALHAAVARLKHESHRAKHPVFGTLTDEEWNKLHLKHASLHMSFLAPAK